MKAWQRHAVNALKMGTKVSEALWYAREGGPVSLAFAAAGLLGDWIGNLTDDEGAWTFLEDEHGLTTASIMCSATLVEIMEAHPAHLTERAKHGDMRTVLWRDEKGAILGGAMLDGSWNLTSGPYLPDDQGAALYEAARALAWAQGNVLVLSAHTDDNTRSRTRTGHRSRSTSTAFMLSPASPPGPFIGEPSPAEYAARLKRYGSGARTVRIRGMSGVGKSVLAQHVATELGGRTLRLPAETIHAMSPPALAELVNMLKPNVLLLDDFESGSEITTWLAAFEAIRVEGVVVIVTQMLPFDPTAREAAPGDQHVDGLRPGRIDETWDLSLPKLAQREAILAHLFAADPGVPLAFLTELAFASEGLSGAYLAEWVKRMRAHGIAHWQRELADIRRAAPRATGNSPDNGKGAVDGGSEA